MPAFCIAGILYVMIAFQTCHGLTPRSKTISRCHVHIAEVRAHSRNLKTFQKISPFWTRLSSLILSRYRFLAKKATTILSWTAHLPKLVVPPFNASDPHPPLQLQRRQIILDLLIPEAKLMVTDLVFGQMGVGAWVSGNTGSCLGLEVCFSQMEASTLENGSMESAMVLACS